MKRFLLGCVAATALGAAGLAQTPVAYDLVIRNGRVLDGAGNPWFTGAVAVKDGRIAGVGVVHGAGRREIDAKGLYVSPGWMDVLDQSGRIIPRNGLVQSKVAQGITTLIGGEGGTPVPAAEVAAYFNQLESQGISVNFGTYYNATQARREVMGDVAGEPTPAQLADMSARVTQAMNAGALGVSSALIYPPASFQTTAELVEIVKAAAPCMGLYATHMRDEGAGLLTSLAEAIEIGEKAGVPVEIFHLKAASAATWGKTMPQAGAMIEAARARGVDVAANMYLYTAAGTGLSTTVPNWVFEEGQAKAMERLKDPAIRARLKAEVAAGDQPGWSNFVTASGGWDGVVLAEAHNPKYDQYNNKSIAEIGKLLGRAPEDVAWDIVVEAMPARATARYFMMDEGDVVTALKFPWVSLGSDARSADASGQMDAGAVPHPRAFGNNPRIIAEYVRKRGVLTLEDAVRKMTSLPASRLRLADRGVIRVGLAADLTIFDYERIQDRATWEEPMLTPDGIRYVIVNGQLVMEDGRHTGARPGQVIKSACAAPS